MCEPAEIDDKALLRAFAREGSETAFRCLVDRHSGWVYAGAFRQLRDAHLAEDATQAVFVLLCQRAKKMKPEQKVSGWLFVTLGYTVKSILRSRRRRQRHEKLAAIERPASCAPSPPPLADDLDAAVARLSEGDRTAILLRFYQGMSFGAIASTLDISDETAKKRVTRAIARLRERLGADVSEGSLTTASAFGVPLVSAALSAQVSHVALGVAGGGAIPMGIAPILKGAVYLMGMAKVKVATIACLIILFMATGFGIVGWEMIMAPTEPGMANMAPVATQAAAPAPSQQRTFEQVYGLQGNDAIRRVDPPYIPARLDFYRKENPSQAQAISKGPDGMVIYWRDGKPQLWVMTFGNGQGFQVQDLLQYLLNTYPQNLEGDTRLATMNIKGDFVIKGDATKEQLRAGLETILGKAAGGPLTLTTRAVQRPVIVFKGKWLAANFNVNPFDRRPNTIELYGSKLDPAEGGGGGSGTIDEFAKNAGAWIKKLVIIEASGAPASLGWHYNNDYQSDEGRKHAHDPALVCKHIQEQTGLSYTEEMREVDQLFIERQK
jgi:RNA polymerase sigma factor (sigma-70 family)